jgi:outer membrane protein assembly factor BamB
MRSPLPRLATAALLALAAACVATAADWSHWRGPTQNGVSPEKNLPAKWDDDAKAPLNFLWKQPYGCRSTPIVLKGRLYINNQVGQGVTEQERVMCLDAETGKLIWEKTFNLFHTDIVSVRLGWTNLVADPATGNIYWHGTQGLFVCFDKDGNILWQHSLTEQYGRISGYGGRLPSPALVGDLVVVGMNNSSWGDQAKGGNRFLAMNKRTGTPVWWSEPGGKVLNSNFSTPTVATINGELLLITGGADGAVHAMQANTGKKVWSYYCCNGEVNCSPAVEGNLVYLNHGQENLDSNVQGLVLCLDAGNVKDGKPAKVWDVPGIKAYFTSPLVQDGRVYIGDNVARLWCLDAKTGAKIWNLPYGRNAMASPVWGDGKIYLSDKNGKFHILQPGDKACKKLDTHFFTGEAGNDVELYGNAAIANGRVYFSTSEEIYCIGVKGAKQQPATKSGDEKVKVGNPTQLQIIPCEVNLHPGDAMTYTAKVYDDKGNFVQDVKAADIQWSLPQPPMPPGAKNQPPALKATFDKGEAGKVVIDKLPPAQQGYVEGTWNGLKAKARVRVVPTLPYAPDFSKTPAGAVPASWVDAQGKYFIKDLNGKHVLSKVVTNSNALIARGSCYFGDPGWTDYTIEADVLGGKVGGFMPDVGVGACRYTLMLAGQTQTLRLVSWDAMPRVDESIAFAWEPNTWYTLKLQADVKGGKATLRGKAWPRGQKEPEAWTVVFEDPKPNLEGSAFLYGYVLGHVDANPGTDVYYDNVRVTPNKK